MQRFGGVVRDTAGNSLSGAQVSVFLSGTATLAPIYSDDNFTVLANPFTANVDGTWRFYAAPGRYDVQYVKSGYAFGTAPTYDQLSYDYMSVITPATITATQNDYAPTNGLAVEQWRLAGDAARTITGISASTAVSGQSLTIFNVGAFSIILNEQDATSAAANRIITGVGNLTLQAGQSAVLKYDTTTLRWRVLAAPITVASANSLFAETFTGLGTSNSAGDPTNDIDVAAGACSSDDATISSRDLMTLAAITKQLDVNWVVGTNQGGLDTGAVANGTYHVFVIKRIDTQVVDVLFSLSPTAPTMPANYTKKRRIGSIVRTGGAIKPFKQDGDYFDWVDPVLDVNNAASGTTANTATLTVPTGVVFIARGAVVHTSGVTAIYISALDITDTAASLTTAAFTGHNNAAGSDGGTTYQCRVSTAAQLRYRASTNGQVFMTTYGWIDRRGRG